MSEVAAASIAVAPRLGLDVEVGEREVGDCGTCTVISFAAEDSRKLESALEVFKSELNHLIKAVKEELSEPA